MKKLRLIGVHSQKEELLRELMLLGCVEVSDPANRPDREELAAFRRSDGGQAWQKRSDQTTIVNALRLLDRHAPAKKGLLTPKPEVECARLRIQIYKLRKNRRKTIYGNKKRRTPPAF